MDAPLSHGRDRAESHDFHIDRGGGGGGRDRGDSFQGRGGGGGGGSSSRHRSHHRSNSPPSSRGGGGGGFHRGSRSRSPPSSQRHNYSSHHNNTGTRGSDHRYPHADSGRHHYNNQRPVDYDNSNGNGNNRRPYRSDSYDYNPRHGNSNHPHGDRDNNHDRDNRDRDNNRDRDRDRGQPVRREIVPRKRLAETASAAAAASASTTTAAAASGGRIPRRASRMTNEAGGGAGGGGGSGSHRSGSPSAQSDANNHNNNNILEAAPLEEPTYRYPIERYVQDPMLCEYLWREDLRIDVIDEFDDCKKKEREAVEAAEEKNKATKKEEDNDDSDPQNNSDEEEKETDDDASPETVVKQDPSATEGEDETAANGQDADAKGDAETAVKIEGDEGMMSTAIKIEATTKSPEESTVTPGAGTIMNLKQDEAEELRAYIQEHPKLSTEAYLGYRKQYGNNVMKCFFNSHLDDEWFHMLYSPRHMVRHAFKERERSWMEAQKMMDDIERHPEQFLEQTRLGLGRSKPASNSSSSSGNSQGNKRKRDGEEDEGKDSSTTNAAATTTEDKPKEEEGNGNGTLNRIPTSHLLSSQDSSVTVKVTNIPSHVTDEQLAHALEEHTHLVNAPGAKVVERVSSVTVGRPMSGRKPNVNNISMEQNNFYCDSLDRTAWVVFVTREAKENMLDNLTKANVEANRGTVSASRRGRKDRRGGGGGGGGGGRDAPNAASKTVLELDITCSDPFGRTDIDADGKGSAPPPVTTESGETQEVSTKIPVRKASVNVYADDEDVHHPQVTVLSASLSSKERIGRDKNSAVLLAREYDAIAKVPSECKLDALITSLFGENEDSSEEDVLDVAIAYLRRIHLCCFYGGAQKATQEGDMLACGSSVVSDSNSNNDEDDNHRRKEPLMKAAASTTDVGMIHLRLQNADALLQKAKEDAAARTATSIIMEDENALSAPVVVDMLVKRLEDAIAKALEDATAKMEASTDDPADEGIVVCMEIDEVAKEAEEDEDAVKETWLANHAVLDADGRARCAFHFCRKLFKDKHFLHKHLLKKHPEYLVGEQAKCHDRYMMQSWETASERPLPRVLVDCGGRHGLQPSILQGPEPIANDPEPELHRRATERQEALEEKRRRDREMREREREARERERQTAIQAKTGFVDVDDMKEEKVQMNFDAAAIEFPVATAPAKKKKKKKKLA
jgi:hypothetical protein